MYTGIPVSMILSKGHLARGLFVTGYLVTRHLVKRHSVTPNGVPIRQPHKIQGSLVAVAIEPLSL